MPPLEPLRPEHGPAVLDFERDNRAYFAASVSDRGQAFFDDFPSRFQDLLAEQESGRCAFHVLLGEAGEVLGRFNLYDLDEGAARVGYRVAQQAAGHGVATAAVRELCRIALELGLHTLTAATADENAASATVLTRAGFVPTGPAGPAELGGRRGTRYRLEL